MPLVRGIIDTAPSPLLVELAVSYALPTALSNPYTGAGSLTAVGGGITPYGLIWTVNSYPPSAGAQFRGLTTFELPFLDLCANYALADATQWFAGNVLTRTSNGFLRFEHGAPLSVLFDILDGWSVNFQWVVAP